MRWRLRKLIQATRRFITAHLPHDPEWVVELDGERWCERCGLSVTFYKPITRHWWRDAG